MNLQPQAQALSKDPTASLLHIRPLPRPRSRPQSFPSQHSNFQFSSFLHPQFVLPLKHKSSPASLNGKHSVLQTVAVYSGDRESISESPAKALRRILDSPGIHQGPACFDALSAKLVERAGFQYCFTSGMFCIFLYF